MFIGGVCPPSFIGRFKGQIDEVRIWKDVVRTSQQIKDNMYYTFQFANPGSCCRYPFDLYTNGHRSNCYLV